MACLRVGRRLTERLSARARNESGIREENRAGVTDTFVLVALPCCTSGREPGSQDVAELLRRAQAGSARVLMTWVNVGEVPTSWSAVGVRTVHAACNDGSDCVGDCAVGRDLTVGGAHIKANHPVAYAGCVRCCVGCRTKSDSGDWRPEFKLLQGVLKIQWLRSEGPGTMTGYSTHRIQDTAVDR